MFMTADLLAGAIAKQKDLPSSTRRRGVGRAGGPSAIRSEHGYRGAPPGALVHRTVKLTLVVLVASLVVAVLVGAVVRDGQAAATKAAVSAGQAAGRPVELRRGDVHFEGTIGTELRPRPTSSSLPSARCFAALTSP